VLLLPVGSSSATLTCFLIDEYLRVDSSALLGAASEREGSMLRNQLLGDR
jgi:hypothetical protein